MRHGGFRHFPSKLEECLIVQILLLTGSWFILNFYRIILYKLIIVIMVMVVVVMMIMVVVVVVVVMIVMVMVVVMIVIVMIMAVVVVVIVNLLRLRRAASGGYLDFHGGFHYTFFLANLGNLGRWGRTGCSCCGGLILALPICGMFLPSKSLIVVAFGGEKLFEMRLAEKLAAHSCVVTQAEHHLAVLTTQTTFMEHLLVFLVLYYNSLRGVHRLAALVTLFVR